MSSALVHKSEGRGGAQGLGENSLEGKALFILLCVVMVVLRTCADRALSGMEGCTSRKAERGQNR